MSGARAKTAVFPESRAHPIGKVYCNEHTDGKRTLRRCVFWVHNPPDIRTTKGELQNPYEKFRISEIYFRTFAEFNGMIITQIREKWERHHHQTRCIVTSDQTKKKTYTFFVILNCTITPVNGSAQSRWQTHKCGNSGRYSREKFGKFLSRATLVSKRRFSGILGPPYTGNFFTALWTIFLHSSLPPIAAATSTDSAVHNATLSISLSSLVSHVPVDSQKFSVGFQFGSDEILSSFIVIYYHVILGLHLVVCSH